MLPRQLIPREWLREIESLESNLSVQMIEDRLKIKKSCSRMGLNRVSQ